MYLESTGRDDLTGAQSVKHHFQLKQMQRAPRNSQQPTSCGSDGRMHFQSAGSESHGGKTEHMMSGEMQWNVTLTMVRASSQYCQVSSELCTRPETGCRLPPPISTSNSIKQPNTGTSVTMPCRSSQDCHYIEKSAG